MAHNFIRALGNLNGIVLILFVFVLSMSCTNSGNIFDKKFFRELSSYTENFDDEKNLEVYWTDKSQNTNNVNFEIEKNHIKLITSKGSVERVKIKFNKNKLACGSYEWRVFVPKMKLNENCSIGAFLYKDDRHELDFEIGSGSAKAREKAMAKGNELLMYCTSQHNPASTKIIKVKEEMWYLLKLELILGVNNNYVAKWFLDGAKVHEAQLNYGRRFKFGAICSLENIHFIGDKPTTVDNYTYFDFFKYSGAE